MNYAQNITFYSHFRQSSRQQKKGVFFTDTMYNGMMYLQKKITFS